MASKSGKRLTRRTSVFMLGGIAGSALLAACGEVEIRYVQGPAGEAGPAGARGQAGAAGAAGAAGSAGQAGETIVVEKPVVVEKVVEKVVEVPAMAAAPKRVVMWTGFWRGGNMSERGTGWVDLTNMWNALGSNVVFGLEPVTGEGVIANFAAGTHPGLMHTAYWSGGDFAANNMVPDLLDTYIKRDKEYADTMDDFFPHLLESSMWQGKLWGLPQETNADLPYTNLDHVRGAGLEPLELGYTWDDFVEYAKTLQASHGPGRESGKWAIGHMLNSVVYLNLFMQAGGEIYNDDYTKIQLNSAPAVEALDWVSDLHHKHQVATPHGDYYKETGKARPSFRNGEITMFYETSAYRLVQWAQNIGGLENMYVTPSPTNKRPFVATFGQNLFLFNKDAADMDASWEVMRWLTSTEPAAHYAAVTMFLAPRKSVLTSPEYAKVRKDVPQFETFVDGLNWAYRPFHPEFPKHLGMMRETLSNAGKAPISAKDSLDEMVRLINASLDKFNQTMG